MLTLRAESEICFVCIWPANIKLSGNLRTDARNQIFTVSQGIINT
jgi:hypothetical protein